MKGDTAQLHDSSFGIEPGDMIEFWAEPRIILKVIPYTGRYPEICNCVLHVQSDTQRGWSEMSFHTSNMHKIIKNT